MIVNADRTAHEGHADASIFKARDSTKSKGGGRVVLNSSPCHIFDLLPNGSPDLSGWSDTADNERFPGKARCGRDSGNLHL